MNSLLEELQALSKSDFYPYHMPGHKRMGSPVFDLDITEIDNFDNLHHATGILKEAQERTAKLYGALESFYLVNGSTCGILTAVFASFQPGDCVLVARNCHKAVYHGLELRGLKPVYLYPDTEEKYDINVGIRAKQVEDALDNTKEAVKGLILTSPTYEGLTSEIKEISEVLHRRDMILIVDEAHGAHFGFYEGFPSGAIAMGADLVIQSLHKTLPSMTQTALLHRTTKRVDGKAVRKYLAMFQTSSPSYVMMAYMDWCIRLLESKGDELFQGFYDRLRDFYKSCERFRHIYVRQPNLQEQTKTSEESLIKYASDPGKIVICADTLSGRELYRILRERFHLQPEMCAGNYVLAIMTISDSKEGFARLLGALEILDDEITTKNPDAGKEEHKQTFMSLLKNRPAQKYIPYEVEALTGVSLPFKEAQGKTSKEYIYLYPPGIPFIVPGEIISKEVIEGLIRLQSVGYELNGLSDLKGEKIEIVKD